MIRKDDDATPPPGGIDRVPGPAGPGEHEVTALDRISDALETLTHEVREVRRLLEQGR